MIAFCVLFTCKQCQSQHSGEGNGSAYVEDAHPRFECPDLASPVAIFASFWRPNFGYNGNFDLICNHIGTDRYLREKLIWGGREAF